VKIELLTSYTCPHCPQAAETIRRYCRQNAIEFVEINSSSKKGKRWSRKFNAMGTPSFVVFGSVRPVFKTGAPSFKTLDEIVAIANGEKEMPAPWWKSLAEKLGL